MAEKVSGMPLAESLKLDDTVPIVQDGVNKKVTVRQVIHAISKRDLGLDQVDNTADMDKPVSIQQQSALNQKANLNHSHGVAEVEGLEAAVQEAVIEKISSFDGAVAVSKSEW